MQHLLRSTATVLRPTELPDGIGGFTPDWLPVGTVRVAIQPLRGQKLIQYQQAGVQVTHAVYAAAGSDVRNGDRLQYGARTFHVESVLDPCEAGHHLEILCREEA